MENSPKTAYVYRQLSIDHVISLLLEKDQIIADQNKKIVLHQNTILDKIDMIECQQEIILKQGDTIEEYHQIIDKLKEEIEEYHQIIDKKKEEIEEQQDRIDLQDKQLLFVKNLVKTVSNVFTKVESDQIPKIEPKVEPKKPRKSNKTEYKLPNDVVSCDTCNTNMRRDCLSRHQKSKTHLKNIENKL